MEQTGPCSKGENKDAGGGHIAEDGAILPVTVKHEGGRGGGGGGGAEGSGAGGQGVDCKLGS